MKRRKKRATGDGGEGRAFQRGRPTVENRHGRDPLKRKKKKKGKGKEVSRRSDPKGWVSTAGLKKEPPRPARKGKESRSKWGEKGRVPFFPNQCMKGRRVGFITKVSRARGGGGKRARLTKSVQREILGGSEFPNKELPVR